MISHREEAMRMGSNQIRNHTKLNEMGGFVSIFSAKVQSNNYHVIDES